MIVNSLSADTKPSEAFECFARALFDFIFILLPNVYFTKHTD